MTQETVTLKRLTLQRDTTQQETVWYMIWVVICAMAGVLTMAIISTIAFTVKSHFTPFAGDADLVLILLAFAVRFLIYERVTRKAEEAWRDEHEKDIDIMLRVMLHDQLARAGGDPTADDIQRHAKMESDLQPYVTRT